MAKLKTWAGKSQFDYSGNVATGTSIKYGEKGYTQQITASQYNKLRLRFLGKIIPIGTSRDNAPIPSIGHWLQENVTKTAIASYVGPILINEGYARKVGKHDIEIIK